MLKRVVIFLMGVILFTSCLQKEPVIKLKLVYPGYDGVYREYYENGKLWADGYFKDDIVEGVAKEYYENGKLEKFMQFKNGKLDGVYREIMMRVN